MNSSELLSEGLGLMLLGMGTVFVFLTILVLVTSLMSFLIQKYAPIKSDSPSTEGASIVDSSKENSGLLAAIISAAIHAHRSKK